MYDFIKFSRYEKMDAVEQVLKENPRGLTVTQLCRKMGKYNAGKSRYSIEATLANLIKEGRIRQIDFGDRLYKVMQK